eukprot:scaffold40657_cov54-Phaeocystis_antarctica.AAC.2
MAVEVICETSLRGGRRPHRAAANRAEGDFAPHFPGTTARRHDGARVITGRRQPRRRLDMKL